jgi:hypothetical protein
MLSLGGRQRQQPRSPLLLLHGLRPDEHEVRVQRILPGGGGYPGRAPAVGEPPPGPGTHPNGRGVSAEQLAGPECDLHLYHNWAGHLQEGHFEGDARIR